MKIRRKVLEDVTFGSLELGAVCYCLDADKFFIKIEHIPSEEVNAIGLADGAWTEIDDYDYVTPVEAILHCDI